MSDLTDKWFYPSADRIWLCIRLNNAGKYCDITLKIMVMFVILWKKVKETDILIDKPKCEKPKTVRTPENIATGAESVCEAPSTSIHRRYQQLNISETLLRRRHTKFNWSWSQLPIERVFASLSGPEIDLQKMPILAQQNHLFRWSSFWFWWVCKQAKLPHLGHRKTAHIHWKANGVPSKISVTPISQRQLTL